MNSLILSKVLLNFAPLLVISYQGKNVCWNVKNLTSVFSGALYLSTSEKNEGFFFPGPHPLELLKLNFRLVFTK